MARTIFSPKKISTKVDETKTYCEIHNSQKFSSSKCRFRSTDLRTYTSIERLLKHIHVKSTADSYLQCIAKVCNFAQINPDEIITLDAGSLNKLCSSFYQEMQNEGLSLKYIHTIIYAMRTLLKFNDRTLPFSLTRLPPRYRKRGEYIPTPNEAKKMMDSAGSLRNSTMIGFIAFGGLRNSTLRAIQHGVCPDPNFVDYSIKRELEKGHNTIALVVHEGMKEIVKEACKGGIPYFTFVPDFVVEKLKAFLNERLSRHERIDNDELLFPTRKAMPKWKMLRTPISSRELQVIVKRAARNTGITNWRYVTPQSLRKTFKLWLINQPPSVRLDIQDQEFLMGHLLAGAMDAYYDKSRVEELREKFSRMVLNEIDYDRAVLQAVCTVVGVDFNIEYAQLVKELGREPSLLEMSEIVKRKLRAKQLPVPIEEIPKYLSEGWRWVGNLSDKVAIIEKI